MSTGPDDLPELPYPDAWSGRTSGWSGSDTSHERAAGDDADGTTKRRQRAVLDSLARAGQYGRTWRELGADLSLHHGQASGALSALHKSGRIARLDARRSRCKVYVLHVCVVDRPTEPFGGRRKTPPGTLRWFPICEPCVRGEGSKCHTPDCALFRRDVPPGGLIARYGLSARDAGVGS